MRRTLAMAAAVILAAVPAVAPMFALPRSTEVVPAIGYRAETQPIAAQSNPAIERMCADYLNGWLTVEVIGDSILYGTDPHWPGLLGRALRPGGAVWNGAGPGTVASDYLPGGGWSNHTEFIRAARPSVVVLGWRTNEQYLYEHGHPRGASPDQLRSNIVQLVQYFRQTTPDTTVIVVNAPRPLRGWNYAGLADYIQALQAAKEQIGGSLWVDLAMDFPQNDQENNTAQGQIQADAVHPSAAGQSTIAAAVRGRINGTCRS